MLREQQVLDLVGQIYDAALDPPRWSDVLSSLTSVFNGNTACLFRQDLSTGKARALGLHNLDLPTFAEYESYYWRKDVWSLNPARHAPETALASHAHINDEALLQSEIYNDFLKPREMFYAVGGLPLIEGARMYMIGLHRPHRGRKRFQPHHLREIQTFLPHIKRALQIHHRLEQSTIERDALLEASHQLPRGVFALDGTGRLLWSNRIGEEILHDADGLAIQRGSLISAVASETRQLRQLIRSSLETASGISLAAGDAMLVSRPSGRRPYVLLVSPMRAGRRRFDDRLAATVIFVSDPDRMPHIPIDRLITLYGLTRVEAQLSLQLASGKDLQEIAAASRRTMNTVRTQLKHVFHKTGTRRQAQLVRLMLQMEGVTNGNVPGGQEPRPVRLEKGS